MVQAVPGFQRFCDLAKKGNLIPVYAEVLADLETPVSAFLKIKSGRHAFLLESVEGGQSQARYSFLGVDPAVIIESDGAKTSITKNGARTVRKSQKDPLLELEGILKAYKFVPSPDLPRFCGGAVGFMGYDSNRFYERIPYNGKKSGLPDLFFMVMDTLLVFDHVQRKIKAVSNAYVPAGASAAKKKESYDQAVAKIQAMLERLRSAHPSPISARPGRKSPGLNVKANFTRERFQKTVKRIKEYIRQGDVIQTVLSQRFETPFSCEPFDIYRALRSINPSPYMFYLRCGAFDLVGSSPEVHVRCEDGVVTLRPIAGTRPRGKNSDEDAKLAKGLLADPKERAEHVMLVDLGRNDLGRVSKIGSVKVNQFMTIEKYSHVMHIVSEVKAKLLPGKTLYDVIRATFPAGTVTGAPKVRAMEILSELEPERRGPYAGLVGYLSFSGNFDSCITIRTMVLKDGVARVQAGAGVVADSDPAKEWIETRNKAMGLLKALELAERGLS